MNLSWSEKLSYILANFLLHFLKYLLESQIKDLGVWMKIKNSLEYQLNKTYFTPYRNCSVKIMHRICYYFICLSYITTHQSSAFVSSSFATNCMDILCVRFHQFKKCQYCQLKPQSGLTNYQNLEENFHSQISLSLLSKVGSSKKKRRKNYKRKYAFLCSF